MKELCMNDAFKSKACLVTGGAGFIGSHVAARLVQDGNQVRVVDNLSTGKLENLESIADHVEFIQGDLRENEVVRRCVEDVDTVFHLAALPSVPRSLADPWASHDANCNASMKLVQAAAETGVRRVVYSSSSSIYGDTPVLPKAESAEPLPRSPYAAAKLAAEQYLLAFARAGLIEAVALRYFNVFGPRQDPHSAYAAVIPAFMQAASASTNARIFGDGRQTRDFTFVSNVVTANILAASRATSSVCGHVFNVGGGHQTSLLELRRLIEIETGTAIDVVHEPERPGDVRDSLACLERAHRGLAYVPEVSIRNGLSETWEWFVNAGD